MIKSIFTIRKIICKLVTRFFAILTPKTEKVGNSPKQGCQVRTINLEGVK